MRRFTFTACKTLTLFAALALFARRHHFREILPNLLDDLDQFASSTAHR